MLMMIRQRSWVSGGPSLFPLPNLSDVNFTLSTIHLPPVHVPRSRMMYSKSKAPFLEDITGSLSVTHTAHEIIKITDDNTAFDPHNYTSGRWLRHDQNERDMRYIRFDFNALCNRVLKLCPDHDRISNCQKIEGGFNRVFIFTLNNSKRVVARLPFRLAGPSRLTTSSEVATIKYCKLKTLRLPDSPIYRLNDA